MAEERPRPGSEEDSDEVEEGEEAAEVPLRPVMEAPGESEEDEGEEAALPEDPQPAVEKVEAPLPPSPAPTKPPLFADPTLRRTFRPLLPQPPRPPLLGISPVYPQAVPEPSPAPPFLFSTPVVKYRPQPAPAAAASSSSTGGVNIFANDGSFMELFKKKMESGSKEEARPEEEDKKPEPERRKPISFVLLRKGGAWAQYMAEVKKYKAHQCSDDDKTRPLVK
ncbi:telomerase RNA component interacting RNase isoform X2 [Pseudophryne corroboree]|uniref:telomerase RNA component interacting RNase isoform X2 n=1 Tax=Pseudophryne corroboree TaxID=495146 RepID=UPI0030813D51